ncbi:MAG: class I SAM-dependent methyltransferase [Methylocella sp.]
MTGKTHENLVADQFGPRAAAYVESAVHAQGEDLLRLVEIVLGHGGARALDMGCGGGHVGFHVAPHVADVVAYDLSEDMLRTVAIEASKRGLAALRTSQGSVECMPFENGEFDFVFSRYSAHHWRDLGTALKEARRVLRPGGAAAFIDVVAPADPLFDTYLQTVELLRDPSHVRDYAPSQWEHALSVAGFRLTKSTARRLRLEFASWISRMGTPAAHAEAILSLQRKMSKGVIDHFAIEADGSFTVDTMAMEVRAA